ncbi:MAG: serine hydrolase [Gemmatimonadota bacterium]
MKTRVLLFFVLALWLPSTPALAQRVGDSGASSVPVRASGGGTLESFSFPDPDASLQRGLERVLARAPFRDLVRQGALSVALIDLSDPEHVRYAGYDEDHMRYAASLPKIGILLGVFDQVEKGELEYTPELRRDLELMIRNSSNQKSSELIRRVGFQTIANVLQEPRYQLYSQARNGGIWVGRGYGGMGLWRRDPIAQLSHGATARQVARFMVMMDQGLLISPWASAEMKDIMGEPAIHHKFVAGLDARPGSRIYRKSGTWSRWHADAALVERDGKKYVAVGLLETERNPGYLRDLIVSLDDLVFRPSASPRVVGSSNEER